MPAADLGQESHAVEFQHSHVGDDQGQFTGGGEDFEGLSAGTGFEAGEPMFAEEAHQGAAHRGLVIDDEAPGRPVRVRFGNRKCHLFSLADGAHEQRQPTTPS